MVLLFYLKVKFFPNINYYQVYAYWFIQLDLQISRLIYFIFDGLNYFRINNLNLLIRINQKKMSLIIGLVVKQ